MPKKGYIIGKAKLSNFCELRFC